MNAVSIVRTYRKILGNREYVVSCAYAFGLLAISIVVTSLAARYARSHASNAVSDIFLSNVPVAPVAPLFIYSSLLFGITIIGTLFFYPRSIPFAVKSIALLYIVRAGFMTLTHIAPDPGSLALLSRSDTYLDPFRFMSTGYDLFFSGHTGLPFMMALLFWRVYVLRVFFLCSSVFFAVVVLLAHVHYSIDVAAAFFITYSVYHISSVIFAKDKSFF